jgi:hypothetical protein
MKVNVPLWAVTPCRDAVGCQRFGGQCCLHIQGETPFSETLVSYRITTRCHNPEDYDRILVLFNDAVSAAEGFLASNGMRR